MFLNSADDSAILIGVFPDKFLGHVSSWPG